MEKRFFYVTGFWLDEKQEKAVTVAAHAWDEEENEEDDGVFYYMGGAPLSVGDVIGGGFFVASIS